MPDRVLITGATGFIGTHLIQHLAISRPGSRLVGTTRGHDPGHNVNVAKSLAHIVPLDLRKSAAVERAVANVRPDYIFHLAAQSLPTVSWKEPLYTLETNVLGTTNLFEAVLKQRLDPSIFVACSSAEYGLVPARDVPVGEDYPLQPLHPYGVSKVAQDLLAYQYFKNFGIRSVRARIFNTTGPRKTGDVLADWTWAIAALERGGGGRLPVGNLRVRRDIADVRDQVRAFDLAVDRLKAGSVYNFCRSTPYQIGDLLQMAVRLSRKKIRPVVAKHLLRPTDEPVIWGDNRKLVRALRFKYKIPIEKTIKDMLNFARNH